VARGLRLLPWGRELSLHGSTLAQDARDALDEILRLPRAVISRAHDASPKNDLGLRMRMKSPPQAQQ
jgi:hypothetical protein